MPLGGQYLVAPSTPDRASRALGNRNRSFLICDAGLCLHDQESSHFLPRSHRTLLPCSLLPFETLSNSSCLLCQINHSRALHVSRLCIEGTIHASCLPCMIGSHQGVADTIHVNYESRVPHSFKPNMSRSDFRIVTPSTYASRLQAGTTKYCP